MLVGNSREEQVPSTGRGKKNQPAGFFFLPATKHFLIMIVEKLILGLVFGSILFKVFHNEVVVGVLTVRSVLVLSRSLGSFRVFSYLNRSAVVLKWLFCGGMMVL